MSLVIAIHHSPDRYALAADSRASFGAGMAMNAPKAFQVGPYLLGYTGALPGAQLLHEALDLALRPPGLDKGPLSRDGVQRVLRQAHREAVTHCGPVDAGRFPATGADLLMVCPAGIAWMDADGTIVWCDEPYRAVGCAEGYAMGWLDMARPYNQPWCPKEMRRCIEAASCRYPGVGGDVVVLEVGA